LSDAEQLLGGWAASVNRHPRRNVDPMSREVAGHIVDLLSCLIFEICFANPDDRDPLCLTEQRQRVRSSL
jgi:hypothetical protein